MNQENLIICAHFSYKNFNMIYNLSGLELLIKCCLYYFTSSSSIAESDKVNDGDHSSVPAEAKCAAIPAAK